MLPRPLPPFPLVYGSSIPPPLLIRGCFVLLGSFDSQDHRLEEDDAPSCNSKGQYLPW